MARWIKYGAIVATGTVGFTVLTLREDKPTYDTTFRGLPPVPSRENQLKKLREKEFDVLVIGGGATGAGCALDAQTRGLAAALVDKGDFSCGTSSRSTKLIHGGIRYLQNAILKLDKEQWDLVCEALSERKHMLDAAPHLSNCIPIMIPVYQWWKLPYFYSGTVLYDLISGRARLNWSRIMSKSKTLEEFPHIKDDNLKGSVVYYDGQQNDSRMNVMLILSAAREGACTLNYTELQDIKHDEAGQVCGAVVKDVVTGEVIEVKTKAIVNATGPLTDRVRKMDDPSAEEICSPSTGVHVVLPRYYCPKNMGLLDPETSDGRVIFFLPWEGFTVAGTTDVPCKPHEGPVASQEEIDFIMKEVKTYFADAIKVRDEDVVSAWSGLRPLVRDPSAKNSAALSRNHVIEVASSGMITVAGGKWTTYRKMAEDAIDRLISEKQIEKAGPCITHKRLVEGGKGFHPNLSVQLCQEYGLEQNIAEHLAHNYGSQSHEVAKLFKESETSVHRIVPDMNYIEAEITYAVRYEYVCHLKDFIFRRTRLSFLNEASATQAIPKVCEIMGKELGWTKERVNSEIVDAVNSIKCMT